MVLEEYEPFSPSDFVVHEIDENQIEADTFDTEIPPLPEMAPALDEDRSEPSKRLFHVLYIKISGG